MRPVNESKQLLHRMMNYKMKLFFWMLAISELVAQRVSVSAERPLKFRSIGDYPLTRFSFSAHTYHLTPHLQICSRI